MKRVSEETMNKLIKFFDEHRDEISGEEDMDRLIEQFMSENNINLRTENVTPSPDTADYYMELAEEAKSKKKKLEYVKKALELEPDNLDAGVMQAELTAKHPVEFLEMLAPLLEKGNGQMEAAGYFQKCMGDFWGIVETRPYMRLRYCYMQTLADNGMMRKACAEGEELLKLCTNDNLGVRYALMHLYACMEDEQAALAINKRYAGDDETQMLLPMAALYFKLGDFERSLSYLQILYKLNPDTKRFLAAAADGALDKYAEGMDSFGYSPDSMDELVYEYLSFPYFFIPLHGFFEWSRRLLRKNR